MSNEVSNEVNKEKLEIKRSALLLLGEIIFKKMSSIGDLRNVIENENSNNEKQRLIEVIGGKIIVINEMIKITRGYYGLDFYPYSVFKQNEKVKVGAKINAELSIYETIGIIKADKERLEIEERDKDKRAKKRRQLMELIQILTKVKMRIEALEVMHGK